MGQIVLTQGKIAVVDDDDLEWVNQWKWCYHNGYATRSIWNGSRVFTVRLHRELLQAPPGLQVDHINGDKLDNRRANLRLATNAQNGMNQKKSSNCTSIYKGVYLHEAKWWRAMIKKDRRCQYSKLCSSEVEAAKQYDQWARELFGEFARLNFPDIGLISST